MVMATTTRFTRRDYMLLPEGFPAQLIEGLLVKDPTPLLPHQVLVSRLVFAFGAHVGEDRVLPAPVDLFIDDENVYQPDVLVFDSHVPFRTDAREVGKPALVVEVLSPSTAGYDRGVKTRRYLDWGVREVWLVDPEARTVEIRGPETTSTTGPGEVARSSIVTGLVMDLARLFRN